MNICLVAHYAYRALTNESAGHIGGVERQIALMARWLAGRGHDVSVVVWDEAQATETMVDGVRILPVCRRSAGIPGLRFFTPRWTSLVRALRTADAELYYHNCAEYVTGQVALWARRNQRKFVYSIASDPECDPRLEILGSLRERVLFRKGLRIADAVVCQTSSQHRQLGSGFGISSVVLPMPCDAPAADVDSRPAEPARTVLWVGRIDRVKRAELLLEAARECTGVHFRIVGPDGDDAGYVESIRSAARALPNVTLHGAVNFAEVWRHYREADALVCTSRFEGFPNTFLEAWSQGLPVVSTVDPDGLLAREQLGAVIASASDCGRVLSDFLADDEMRRRCSENAYRYFKVHHQKDAAMRRFEELFENVIRDIGPQNRDNTG